MNIKPITPSEAKHEKELNDKFHYEREINVLVDVINRKLSHGHKNFRLSGATYYSSIILLKDHPEYIEELINIYSENWKVSVKRIWGSFEFKFEENPENEKF